MAKYVEEIMQRQVLTVTPDTPVRELLRRLVGAQVSGMPVVGQDGEIVGVVSATDVVRLGAEAGEIPRGDLTWEPLGLPQEEFDEESSALFFVGPEDVVYGGDEGTGAFAEGVFEGFTVAQIMTPAAFTVKPRDTVRECAKFLLHGRIHRALVVEAEQLQGIVTAFDLLKAFLEDEEDDG